jgi:hypothetical protein
VCMESGIPLVIAPVGYERMCGLCVRAITLGQSL